MYAHEHPVNAHMRILGMKYLTLCVHSICASLRIWARASPCKHVCTYMWVTLWAFCVCTECEHCLHKCTYVHEQSCMLQACYRCTRVNSVWKYTHTWRCEHVWCACVDRKFIQLYVCVWAWIMCIHVLNNTHMQAHICALAGTCMDAFVWEHTCMHRCTRVQGLVYCATVYKCTYMHKLDALCIIRARVCMHVQTHVGYVHTVCRCKLCAHVCRSHVWALCAPIYRCTSLYVGSVCICVYRCTCVSCVQYICVNSMCTCMQMCELCMYLQTHVWSVCACLQVHNYMLSVCMCI